MSRRSSGEYSPMEDDQRTPSVAPGDAPAGSDEGRAPTAASPSPSPKAGATVSGNASGTNVAIQISLTLSAMYIVLIAIACTGTLLVWFEAEYLDMNIPGSDGAAFFTLTIVIVLFALSVVPNYFVPPTHTAVLKRFALFLFINNIDALVCRAHLFVIHDVPGNNNNSDHTIIRTARAGAVLVLMAVFPAFFLTFMYHRKPVKETAKKVVTLKGVVSTIAAVLLFIGQCLMWGLKDNCSLPNSVFVHNASPLIFSILLLTTTVFDDKATQDVIFFFMVHYLISTVPIFESGQNFNQQDHFGRVWRAEMAFLFLGALIYLLGMLMDRIKHHLGRSASLKKAGEQKPTVRQQMKKASTVCQLVLLVLSVPAAVMIWSWSAHFTDANTNSRMANYLAALGVLVPLFNVIGALASFDFLSFVGLLLSFNIAPLLGWMVTINTGFQVSSFYRAGVILLLIVLILSPALSYVNIPKQRVDEYFSGQRNRATEGRPSPIMLFLIWCLGAAYSWSEKTTVNLDTMFGNALFPTITIVAFLTFFSCSFPDVQRLLYLQLSLLVTNPKIWPISDDSYPSFSTVFVLLNGLLFVTFYAWDHPDAYLEGLHYEAEGSIQVGISVKNEAAEEDHLVEEGGRAEDPLLAGHQRTQSQSSTSGGTFDA